MFEFIEAKIGRWAIAAGAAVLVALLLVLHFACHQRQPGSPKSPIAGLPTLVGSSAPVNPTPPPAVARRRPSRSTRRLPRITARSPCSPRCAGQHPLRGDGLSAGKPKAGRMAVVRARAAPAEPMRPARGRGGDPCQPPPDRQAARRDPGRRRSHAARRRAGARARSAGAGLPPRPARRGTAALSRDPDTRNVLPSGRSRPIPRAVDNRRER